MKYSKAEPPPQADVRAVQLIKLDCQIRKLRYVRHIAEQGRAPTRAAASSTSRAMVPPVPMKSMRFFTSSPLQGTCYITLFRPGDSLIMRGV